VVDFCWRLIAPGLVAARAAVAGSDAARRITAIEVFVNGSRFDPGAAFVAEAVTRVPGRTDLSIVVAERVFARATVVDNEASRQHTRRA
jgi:hypothetical protein